MKKAILFAVLALLLSPLLMGVTTITANAVVVEWDAVTQTTEGDPIPPAQITYEVLRAPETDRAAFVVIEEVSLTTSVVLLPIEGMAYLIGVRAIRNVEGLRLESTIAWSDEAENPFVVMRVAAPAAPLRLRIVE